MINEKVLEMTLPEYLKNDIEALKEGYKNKSTVLDCLLDEVQGSINLAFYSNELTHEEAAYLRKKYLGLEDFTNGQY